MSKTIILSHYSNEPFNFNPDYDFKYQFALDGIKPKGMWFSDDSDYGWPHWCKSEQFRLEFLECKKDFELSLERICVLSSYADIARFTHAYDLGKLGTISIEKFYMDWAKVREDYAGLLITPYVWKARFDFMWFYGWDCASACVWDLSTLKELPANDREKKGEVQSDSSG